MSNIFLYILVFTLPLIHSSFLNYFWFDFNSLVNWNFEFTKVIFFAMISSLVIISFFVERFLKKRTIKIIYPKILIMILLLIISWTFFSISPFISLFWNNIKWHWALMILNLLWIFIVLINKDRKLLNKLLKISLLSVFVVLLIWIKEYFFPSLKYENTINSTISTFWNKQYLSLYLLLFIPIIFNNYKPNLKNILFYLLFFLVFFLTKSLISIWLFFVYLLFFLLGKKRWFLTSIIFFIVWFLIIFFYFPEKLHSFISRFYIWKNTLSIIFWDLKIIIFWNWFETLDLVFNREKNPLLYIYENYGFTADRSHNFFLDIFYSTWIFWLILGLCVCFLVYKETKNTIYFASIILFFAFSFFNFSSIVHYVFLLLIISIVLVEKNKNTLTIKNKKYLFFVPIIFYFFSLFYFINFYFAEINYKNYQIQKALNIFKYPAYFIENWMYEKWLKYYKIKPEIYYKNLIINDKENLLENCREFTNYYKTAENYFWCWSILELENYKNESLVFYQKWLLLIPDLWNLNSKYFNNFFIKHTISWNRFYSKKFSNIKEVLEKLEKNNIYVK